MRKHPTYEIFGAHPMYPLARLQVLSVLRGWGTWISIGAALFLAWAGVTLDLFGFDGGEARAVGVCVGTFEIAAVLLAIRTRVTGISAMDPDGFQGMLLQRSGPATLEFGAVAGCGAGSVAACLPGLLIIFAFYNFFPRVGVQAGGLLLLGLGAKAALAAAWVGFTLKIAGRVPAIAVGVGGFVLARLAIPLPLRAILPSPLPLDVGGLLVHTATTLLATIGLALAASTLADSGVEVA